MFLNAVPFKNHSLQRKPKMDGEYLVCSIDPGINNTSVYIEKRYANKTRLKEFKLINCSGDYSVMTKELDKFIYLNSCSVVLIESQLSRNPKAMRMMQHIISYLLIKTDYPKIIEVSPKFKTQKFNAPRMKSKETKKWSIVKARELLEERNDTFALDIFNSMKKKDDISDTICYCEAWDISDEKLKC